MFHIEYLIKQRSPTNIIANEPALAPVWSGMIGTSEGDHYGRPFSFHQQAQKANWPAAWREIATPVLVLYGEYDWVEDLEGHRWIVEIVNARRPQAAELHVLPQTNHNFSRYPDRKAAFDEEGGDMVGDEAASLIASWISQNLRE